MKTEQIQSKRKYGNCASRLVSWFNDCAPATATISVKLLCNPATAFLTARELFLGVAKIIVASHADVLRGSSRVSAPRKEYEGLWVCSKSVGLHLEIFSNRAKFLISSKAGSVLWLVYVFIRSFQRGDCVTSQKNVCGGRLKQMLCCLCLLV